LVFAFVLTVNFWGFLRTTMSNFAILIKFGAQEPRELVLPDNTSALFGSNDIAEHLACSSPSLFPPANPTQPNNPTTRTCSLGLFSPMQREAVIVSDFVGFFCVEKPKTETKKQKNPKFFGLVIALLPMF
jgi:hypothetical protein